MVGLPWVTNRWRLYGEMRDCVTLFNLGSVCRDRRGPSAGHGEGEGRQVVLPKERPKGVV